MNNALLQKRKHKVVYLINNNRLEEAGAILNKTCKTDCKDPDVWFMLGTVYGRLGKMPAAIEQFKKVVKLQPNNALAYSNLANAQAASGEFSDAIKNYKNCLRIDPSDYTSLANLGNVLHRSGCFDESLKALKKAVALQPKYAYACHLLGKVYWHMGQPAAAIECYQRTVRNDPDNYELWTDLGYALLLEGRLEESQSCLEKALLIRPDFVMAMECLATNMMEQGKTDEGITYFNKVVSLAPKNSAAHCHLGAALMIKGDFPSALESFRNARKHPPVIARAISGEADVLQRIGDLQGAYEIVRKQIDEGETDLYDTARVYAAICNKYGNCDEAIKILEELAIRTNANRSDIISCYYALGRLYDRQGRYQEAFNNYRRANELSPYKFHAVNATAFYSAIIKYFSSLSIKYLPRVSEPAKECIFIVGMPRSGTSLVEQILASHPEVHAAGELNTMANLAKLITEKYGYPNTTQVLPQEFIDNISEQYKKHIHMLSGDKKIVTDKMPSNFIHLGLIYLLFPGARVIHCRRNPLDTCLSIYFQNFAGGGHPYATNLHNLGIYYKEYSRLINHWKQVLELPMLEVQYEDLVKDQESMSRTIIEFCGLDWTAQCLEFYKSDRITITASYDQVRQPIYARSIDRWRNYESFLTPLLCALGMQDNSKPC